MKTIEQATPRELDSSVLFTSKEIGNLTVRNRFIRAATSETMASNEGEVTDSLVELHERLAVGGVGLQILGHAYVHPSGRYHHRQTGIHADSLLSGLTRLTKKVHEKGGLIFAQLTHAGSQTRANPGEASAPSPVQNPLTGTIPRELTEEEIWEIIEHFGAAARRAVEAGFDGIHIHGANGYLISEFSSPFSNRRTDQWGGDERRRDRFLMEVYQTVRKSVGSDFPVTLKLGMEDAVPDGLTIHESIDRASRLEADGLSAIEVSCGVMVAPTNSARKYVAVDTTRALSDLLWHRLFRKGTSEGYFLPYATALKRRLKIPIILVGGLRTVENMEKLVARAEADFIALARPFIREPALVSQIRGGRRGRVSCTSCNLCLDHEGEFELMCWRKSKRLLARALYKRVFG